MVSEIISMISLTTALILNPMAQSARPTQEVRYNAQSKSVIVPEGKGRQVIIDGVFSKGEWDDALRYSIMDGGLIYQKQIRMVIV